MALPTDIQKIADERLPRILNAVAHNNFELFKAEVDSFVDALPEDHRKPMLAALQLALMETARRKSGGPNIAPPVEIMPGVFVTVIAVPNPDRD